jgi:predicted signal transduction protein with EAL and GGDEF domain
MAQQLRPAEAAQTTDAPRLQMPVATLPRPRTTSAGLGAELLLGNFAQIVGADVALLVRPNGAGQQVQVDSWGLASDHGPIEAGDGLLALSIRHPGALDRLIGAPRHDPLTGCVDYEGTRHELSREINRSVRGGLRLSICFIDLDGFKLVNDHDGHHQTDEPDAHQIAQRLLADAQLGPATPCWQPRRSAPA